MKEVKLNILEFETALKKLGENPPKPKEVFYRALTTGYYSINGGPAQLLEENTVYKVNQDYTLEKYE